MNYFLILLILGLCAGAYYQHTQDEQQVASLQQQLAEMSAKLKAEPANSGSPGGASSNFAPSTGRAPAPFVHVVPVLPPDKSRSTAIDTAAAAATAAQNAEPMGTISTLDGRSFQNCKILKVEADGITFSHSDGITKVLFPLLRPELQKKYGYDPQQAVAATHAEIQYQQAVQQQQSSPAAAPVTTSNPQ